MCIWVPYRGSMLRRHPYTHYSQGGSSVWREVGEKGELGGERE